MWHAAADVAVHQYNIPIIIADGAASGEGSAKALGTGSVMQAFLHVFPVVLWAVRGPRERVTTRTIVKLHVMATVMSGQAKHKMPVMALTRWQASLPEASHSCISQQKAG